jgi:hypothetical protein
MKLTQKDQSEIANLYSEMLVEAFSDLGKLSPEQLTKGYRLNPNDEDNFKQVSGRVFHNALEVIKNNDDMREVTNPKYFKAIRKNLSTYPIAEYNAMKCFLGKNNSSGFCIKDGDELVSLFSSLESSGRAAASAAIENGATRLDCFATQDQNGNIKNEGLYKLYSSVGFVIDESLTTGELGTPYTIQNGISYFVGTDEVVNPNHPTVVVYMKLAR